jgi:hypothetical protein
MLSIITQFKEETNVKMCDLERMTDLSQETLRPFLSGKFKNKKTTPFLITLVSSQSGIEESIIRKYAMGLVEIKPQIEAKKKSPTYKEALERIVSLEKQMLQIIGE